MENKILEKLQGRLMRKIDVVEKNIVTYKEKFGEDYEKFGSPAKACVSLKSITFVFFKIRVI